MKNLITTHSCCNCLKTINDKVFDFSIAHFEFALCVTCQDILKDKIESTTAHTLALYLLLRKRGVRAELEKFDGFKTIDIAVVEAKVNIEIDGAHHNTKHEQALADLKRTYYSLEKGYYTLRIPNSLVKNHLTETARYVFDIVQLHRRR